ncbi:protein phosphatase 2A scaffold subunit [Pelomyxa schiedti]|nr:protein phosphatase 2A scaffold subunit [Pelomyxa schiedti]
MDGGGMSAGVGGDAGGGGASGGPGGLGASGPGTNDPVGSVAADLLHDDVHARIGAMRRLPLVAQQVGAARTRDELIPFLLTPECLDDEDEVLGTMAEEIGRMIDLVGGAEFAPILVGPLGLLVALEESTVREKAIESLALIAPHIPASLFMDTFMGLITRLLEKNWFTTLASAASLLPIAYPRVPDSAKAETRGLFWRLCKDASPIVRAACLSGIGVLAKHLEPRTIKSELIPMYNILCSDQNDAIRMRSVESITSICSHLPPTDMSIVLPLVLSLFKDKSWRVRRLGAQHIVHICDALGPTITQHELLNTFLTLLRDLEAEVRAEAAIHTAEVAKRVPKELVLTKVVPCLRDISLNEADPSPNVRAAIAANITSLASILGKEDSERILLEMIQRSLEDEFPEVRLNLLTKLDSLHDVIGVETFAQTLLNLFPSLCEDPQWRVRRAVIHFTPQIAAQLGISVFDEKLCSLWLSWLTDPVFAVRKETTLTLAKLTQLFGIQWAQQTMIPRVLSLHCHTNYLYRETTLFALSELSSVVDMKVITSTFMPLVLRMAQDPVANVRYNVAKTLQVMIPHLESATLVTRVKPLLSRLAVDPDKDVQAMASLALSKSSV